MPQYSEEIINQLPGIDYRLYRYHTTRMRNKYIKDLNRLGRPLDKVIIVDNDEESFALQH
jgi:RNA polymerase II subunit A small phosphatase-like protein